MINYKQFTVGIEEEYMVIDPATKALISHEQKIVAEGQKIISEKVKAEMHQAVVEVGTDVCANIEEAKQDKIEKKAILLESNKKTGTEWTNQVYLQG